MERRTLTELRAGTPLRVGELTIVLIEERHVTVGCDGRRVFAGADKRPAGIVVLGVDAPHAFAPDGRPLDLETLVGSAVGLRDVLADEGAL